MVDRLLWWAIIAIALFLLALGAYSVWRAGRRRRW